LTCTAPRLPLRAVAFFGRSWSFSGVLVASHKSPVPLAPVMKWKSGGKGDQNRPRYANMYMTVHNVLADLASYIIHAHHYNHPQIKLDPSFATGCLIKAIANISKNVSDLWKCFSECAFAVQLNRKLEGFF